MTEDRRRNFSATIGGEEEHSSPPAKGRQPGRGKQPSTGRGRPPKRKGGKKRIFLFILPVFLALGGYLGYKFYLYYQEQQLNKRLVEIAANANDIVIDITTALNSKAPSTWVYDRDENLIMTLTTSTALQSVDTIPTEIAEAIRGQAEQGIARQILQEYILNHTLLLTEEQQKGYLLRLENSFTEDDLIRYLAITSKYGGTYIGLSEAVSNYFGVTIEQLNTQQLLFVAASYRNDTFNIENYIAQTGLSEDRLGLVLHKSGYTAVRTEIMSELRAIPDIDIDRNSYMIKLSTSTQQQSILQGIIDNSMRQLIDLNTDGTYTLDCSVVVADRNTGYIRAWVPGRSSSQTGSRPFMMNVMHFMDNFVELRTALQNESTLGFQLKEVEKPNGDSELRAIQDLYESQLLATGGNTAQLDAISLLRKLFAPVESVQNLSLIYQITDANGVTVYKAPGTTQLYFNNRNLCYYFAGEEDSMYTEYGDDFQLDTGVVSFKSTADYVLIAIAGSGAVGGSVTSSQASLLMDTISQIKTAIATFYPTPTRSAWSSTGLDVAIAECYKYNQAFIESIFDEDIQELIAIEIDSTASRSQFELKYEQMSQFVDAYESFVGTEYADSLRAALQEVRVARTELLVLYST